MKSESNINPSVLHNLGNGSWNYNYNITSTLVTDSNGVQSTVYQYETVNIWEPITYGRLVSAIIRDKYTVDDEFSLQRQRDTDPTEFITYNTFCENAKAMTKSVLNIT